MHTRVPSILIAVILVVGLATATGESIVAESFTDSSCTVQKTLPQSLNSGECVFTWDYQFYYTIFEHPNNTAQYRPLTHKVSNRT
jgi:hypothetical protein